MPDNRPIITVTQGATLKRSLATPWDLTGCRVTALLKDESVDNVEYPFTIQLVQNPRTGLLGTVAARLSALVTVLLVPGKSSYAFDFKFEFDYPNGDDVDYPTGKIQLVVEGRITP